MNITNANNRPSFGGRMIFVNSGTEYIRFKLNSSPVIQRFVEKFDGDIFVDSAYRTVDKYSVSRGADEELFKVYLSNAEPPVGFWNKLKALFNPNFSRVSLTRHFRDDSLIAQAIDNESKLTANLKKLKPRKSK